MTGRRVPVVKQAARNGADGDVNADPHVCAPLLDSVKRSEEQHTVPGQQFEAHVELRRWSVDPDRQLASRGNDAKAAPVELFSSCHSRI